LREWDQVRLGTNIDDTALAKYLSMSITIHINRGKGILRYSKETRILQVSELRRLRNSFPRNLLLV
jgi:hypothetical protein